MTMCISHRNVYSSLSGQKGPASFFKGTICSLFNLGSYCFTMCTNFCSTAVYIYIHTYIYRYRYVDIYIWSPSWASLSPPLPTPLDHPRALSWAPCVLQLSNLLLFTCYFMPKSLQLHGLQHARLFCPPLSPRLC